MSKYTPTPETVEFAKETIRVFGLTWANLSTQADIERLERLGERAQSTQRAANTETDQRRGRWT